MEQRTCAEDNSSPRFLLAENQCTSPFTETDAESLLWPSSDEYLGCHSTSSGDDIPDVPSPFEEEFDLKHQQGESSGDDVSSEPLKPSRPFKQYAAEAFASSDWKSSLGPAPSRKQRGTKCDTVSSDEPAEEPELASTHLVPRSVAPSPTSLEESIVAYFAAHNLETPGFSHPAICNPSAVLLTSNPQKHGAEPSYSAPDKRSSFILTSDSAERGRGSTSSAPERTYFDSYDLHWETRLALQRRRFGPLWSMNHESLIRLAVDVRNSVLTEHERCLSCRVMSRLNGSFNMVYILQFEDGLKYVVRLPALGWGDRWTSTAKKAFESQVLTMHLIQRMTTIPLPEILAFDATQGNSLEAPYMVISFISGVTVERLWWDETGPTPLEDRRSRILASTALAMVQLQNLKFDRIGSLELKDKADDKTLGIGPCYDWNLPSRHAETQGQDPTIREFGPFHTTREYLTHLHDLQDRDPHPMCVGCRELLTRMIASLPPSVDEALDVSTDETFVLTAPDFDSQNFMIDERGNLTGIIDWDHVQTMPRSLGYCRYPEWITRDCDPVRYEYPSGAMQDSPQQLRQYRKQYAAEVVRLLRGDGDARFAKKSHIVGAVWIAAARQDCQVSLMAKLLDRALARDQYSNKYALMEDVGEGNWTLSEAEMTDRFRELFEVPRVVRHGNGDGNGK